MDNGLMQKVPSLASELLSTVAARAARLQYICESRVWFPAYKALINVSRIDRLETLRVNACVEYRICQQAYT